MIPVAPFYRLCREDGPVFDYADDQAALDRQINALNPVDVAGCREFLKFSQQAFEQSYIKLGSTAFLSFRSMVQAGPQLVKLQAWNSVYCAVSRFIQNERLRQFFSFHSLLVGGNPFEASSIYTLIHVLERKGNVWFPRGGTGALVQALLKLFKDWGGTVLLNSPVERIEPKGDRAVDVWVQVQQQRCLFDQVASNADVVHTSRQLCFYGTGRGHSAS